MKYTLKNALSENVLRGRRTWCYLVEDSAGEIVGKLRKARTTWTLSITQKQFVPTPGSLARSAGITNSPCKGFKTVAEARKFLKNPTFAMPKKKRKPMTKKQRIAASKRLEKARATKARLMEREIQNRLEEFGF